MKALKQVRHPFVLSINKSRTWKRFPMELADKNLHKCLSGYQQAGRAATPPRSQGARSPDQEHGLHTWTSNRATCSWWRIVQESARLRLVDALERSSSFGLMGGTKIYAAPEMFSTRSASTRTSTAWPSLRRTASGHRPFPRQEYPATDLTTSTNQKFCRCCRGRPTGRRRALAGKKFRRQIRVARHLVQPCRIRLEPEANRTGGGNGPFAPAALGEESAVRPRCLPRPARATAGAVAMMPPPARSAANPSLHEKPRWRIDDDHLLAGPLRLRGLRRSAADDT